MSSKPLSGRQVRAIRNWLGMSRPEFARNCSIGLSSLMDYELGNRRQSDVTIEAVARYVARLEGVIVKGGHVRLPS